MTSNKLTLSLLGLAAVALAAFAPFPRQAAAKPTLTPWVVLLDVGAKFKAETPIQQMPGFAGHLALVNRLAGEGTLLLGGPLFEDSKSGKLTGALWVVQAESAEAVKKLVGSDPFVTEEMLSITSIRAFMAGAGAWIPAAKPAAAGK